MKKVLSTAIVASIIAGAGAAQAITLYENNGLKYDLKGDWQIQYRQMVGEDQDLDMDFDDLEFKNRMTYSLTDTLSAFGELDWGGKKAAGDSSKYVHLEEGYLGLQYDNLKFQFGKTNTASDSFGVADYKEAVVADDAFDYLGTTDGDDLTEVIGDFGAFNFVASYELEADNGCDNSYKNGKIADIYGEFAVAGLTVGAAVQNFEDYDSDDDINSYGISASYDAKVVTLSADYSEAEDTVEIINVWVSVPVQAFTFGLGFQNFNFDDSVENDADIDYADQNIWYANVIYKFPSQPNVRLFAEISDTDADNTDMGYLAGMRILF